MSNRYLKVLAATTIFTAAGSIAAQAETFNIPGGDLDSALESYSVQSGVQLMVPNAAVHGIRTKGVRGDLSDGEALSRILSGTGFTSQRDETGVVGIVREQRSQSVISDIQLAQAAPSPRAVETVTVTSSKLGGADVQSIPIAITALSQEQLTSTQTAGGPDLVKQVPNLTFSKTNFTGYNIQIRGIGTQAISATTDPAVAVSFNDVPFMRNHFFEQEFFDVSQVEVLRGPQGTLYGRNATSGVVNVIAAKPTDHYEAMASVDVGNYNNRRLEGMLNVPILDDKLDLRVAGEWTKRDGYAYNETTGNHIDGRNLWSGRVSLLIHPIERLTATFVWEHFQEDDNRARSTKQLCARDNAPAVVDGPAGPQVPAGAGSAASPNNIYGNFGPAWLSQGCRPASLYSPESFQTPNAGATPFIAGLTVFGTAYLPLGNFADPYASVTQSTDLRTVSSQVDPLYRARNDTYEFNVDFNITPALTLTSQTAYNNDVLLSSEDYNRFNTAEGFLQDPAVASGDPNYGTSVGQDNQYCDPQLGCSSRFVAQDRSSGSANQFYQEVRLASNFSGPLNFVAGGNYLKFHVSDDYYVFSNLLTLLADIANSNFGAIGGDGSPPLRPDAPHIPFDPAFANYCQPRPANLAQANSSAFFNGLGCMYIDPNPIDKVNGQGHNYFLSHNPYQLDSRALFGEINYQLTPDVKLTGGLRYTDDRKDFQVFPSWADVAGKGLLQTGDINQEWREFTGRAVVNWMPKLDFTDQTLVYGSFAHGYKGGGANPPGVVPIVSLLNNVAIGSPSNLTHPATFKPEFNNAFELGTKNALLDGALTLNGDVFLYKYKNYQISQIVDRTAVNLNFNATVKGAELETTWEPLPGLKLGFTGGYEQATIDDGQSAIDLMDRTAGHTDWMVVRPWVTQTSNCILPTEVVNELLQYGKPGYRSALTTACNTAYSYGSDPVSGAPNQVKYPGYTGFDPSTAPNNGEGFAKDLSGNQLPNTPHFTTSLTADYTMPVSSDWVGTLHGDFYWHSNSFARVFNDRPYDELRGYTNINLALIFTNQDGWQAMAYVKNLADNTAITGTFLNSDDTSLTTNVFVTDPRLFGIRITKNW
jgi:outer membrane receptor protein involved in Fe transport